MEFDFQEMGARIKSRRKALGFKQHELAERIGVSNNHMSSIELGRNSMSIEVFANICYELRVSPDYLLLGVMHSNNLPKKVYDALRLCEPKDVEIIDYLVQFFVRKKNQMD